MLKKRLLAVLTLGLLAVLATGCIVSVEPETAENPVGTEHTVTVTLLDPDELDEEEFCDNLEDELEGYDEEDFSDEELEILLTLLFLGCGFQEGSTEPTAAVAPASHNFLNFEIVSGPNVGLNSDDAGGCEPSCVAPPIEGLEVSWTYTSNGVAGTDVIEVCMGGFDPEFPEVIPLPPVGGGSLSVAGLLPDEYATLEEIFLNVLNETLGTDHETLEEFLCQEVEKTWVVPEPEVREDPIRPRPPNIGAGLSGLFAGQPTPLPTTAAPAAPSPVIRPPSTGDAGLK
jgi:hypothetical protein